MSLIGALTQVGGKAVKKTAPFYSAVDEALANLKRNKGTGAEFYTELTKQPGVKKAELADRKLEQAFKAKGKMTKEEAQQVLKENPPPKLQEKVLDERDFKDYDDIVEELAQEKHRAGLRDLSGPERRDIYKEADKIFETQEAPKYQDYKTPGGKNYREILLKLPIEDARVKNAEENVKRLKEAYRQDRSQSNFFAVQNAELELDVAKAGQSAYRSSHWKEDPNVLAHMRVQDRTGPNGEKILHVEEIQSDWHQEGRKKGYATKEHLEKWYNEGKLEGDPAFADLSNEQLNILERNRRAGMGNDNSVPDAPFKKNWHELAMKRLLNYAADKGYDSIALTPGAEQAKRFSLSKQLNEVLFDPNTGHLAGRDHNGKLVVAQQGVTPENLADYIGKEGAQKILETPADKIGIHALRGADLEVGGEGMKGFYDKILPDYLNSFGKPYGAQVESAVMPLNTPELKKVGDKWQYVDNFVDYPMHTFKVTPEMRESIKQKGLPLYQQIGIPTAGAGAASQVPEEPEYQAGGSVAKLAALAKMKALKEEMLPRAEAVKNLMALDENKYLRDVTPNVLTNPEIEAEIARMKARAEAAQPEVKRADGGAVNFNTDPDMSDGGRIIEGAPFKRGGKVKLTTNRDTMFMELSNKKLKRK